MRADSPRLPGGGGTSAPSSGGGHVGPGHVIRRRNALGVKVHGRAGGCGVCVRADPGQETAAGLATGVDDLLGPPPSGPSPGPPRTLRPSLDGPLGLPATPRSRPRRSTWAPAPPRARAQGSTSKGVDFPGGKA